LTKGRCICDERWRATARSYATLEVQEILREPYSGRAFPGYEEIHLSFAELETLVHNAQPDWKAALESVKGIYLITDDASRPSPPPQFTPAIPRLKRIVMLSVCLNHVWPASLARLTPEAKR